MSSPVPTLDQRRFTVDKYHRMAETGILAPEERVELIRGVVRKMSPKNRAHVIAAALGLRPLARRSEGIGERLSRGSAGGRRRSTPNRSPMSWSAPTRIRGPTGRRGRARF